MNNYILSLIENYGYFGMFLGMILEAVIIAIPSELILATGGILASKGIFNFYFTFLVGLLGSVFCAIIIYCIGYFGGRTFIKKYGKFFFMKEKDIDKTDSWYNKYGLIAAAVGRNIPIVRTLISLPMGIARFSFTKFVIYTTLGSIPWTFVFVYFGYALGNNWTMIKSSIDNLKIPIIFLIILLYVSRIFIRKTKR